MPSITDPSPCPVCGFDAGTVGRADAVVALRTFPRRFRSVGQCYRSFGQLTDADVLGLLT